MAKYWYAFVGGLNGDPRLSANYSLSTTKPNCLGGRNICAIYTERGDLSPAAPLSLNILLYIANAKLSGLSEPRQPGEKKFVYLTD